jgi:hypothetical protein
LNTFQTIVRRIKPISSCNCTLNICFKIPVKRFNSCQTNDCPMLLSVQSSNGQFAKTMIMIKHLIARIEKCIEHFPINKSVKIHTVTISVT